MTDKADDPFYLYVLLYPGSGERRAVVFQSDRYTLADGWEQQRFELKEMYRLRDEAREQYNETNRAWRASDPGSNQGLDFFRLEESEKHLKAYAQELDRLILEQEALGRIKKPTD